LADSLRDGTLALLPFVTAVESLLAGQSKFLRHLARLACSRGRQHDSGDGIDPPLSLDVAFVGGREHGTIAAATTGS
jgi:hypothetical protein